MKFTRNFEELAAIDAEQPGDGRGRGWKTDDRELPSRKQRAGRTEQFAAAHGYTASVIW